MDGEDNVVFLVPGDPDCHHESTEYMGGDSGNNEYYECLECTGVLIRTGDRDFRDVREERQAEQEESSQHPFQTEDGGTVFTGLFDDFVDRLRR